MTIKKYSLFLLFFLGGYYIGFGQEKEIVEIEPDTSTFFHWGAITVPLTNTSLRDTKGKRIAMKPFEPTVISINELLLSLRERMFLYKGNQLNTNFKTINLSFSPSYNTVQKLVKRGVPAKEAQSQLHQKRYTLKLTDNEPKELTETIIQKITRIIDHDTRVNIMVNKGKMMGNLIVKAIYAPYEPPAIVKHTTSELFKFQLLEPKTGATILRIDTTENKRVFNMYQSDNKTKILHIPNFKTATRTAAEKEEIDLIKILKQASSYPTPEALHLLEYVDYTPTDLTLSLGKLEAAPESRNYALKTFLANQGELSLQHKDLSLKIKSFRLTIFDKAGQARSHWVKVSKKDKWLKYLVALSHENSIYFDKIIIEKGKQRSYLGQAFLFKIGKDFLDK